MKKPGKREGHAVVIGGSLGGLLAARVLADRFERVTLIERAAPPDPAAVRATVPQGGHIHVLLARGARVLERLFPGLFDGLPPTHRAELKEFSWFHFGTWRRHVESPLVVNLMSRPFLDWNVQRHVARLPNVAQWHQVSVSGLLARADGRGVGGVSVKHPDGREETLQADLVIDAAGRGTQTPRWLPALGFVEPEESRIEINLGYTTWLVQLPEPKPTVKGLAVYCNPPTTRRGGLVFPVENGLWIATLQAYHGDFAPDDWAGALAFAASLDSPEVFEMLKDAKPVGSVQRARVPYYRWRHLERLHVPPAGIVSLGDAMVTLDPTYGHGMGLATLHAEALAGCLDAVAQGASLDELPRRFYRQAAKHAESPWLMCASENFRFAETVGERPANLAFTNWYKTRVIQLAGSNDAVARAFYDVVHMLQPVWRLALPDISLRVAASLFSRPASR